MALVRVRGAVQNYAWGKVGGDAMVAQLAAAATDEKGATDAKHAVDSKKTYAELWFGTHPSGPSEVIASSSSAATPTKLQAFLGEELPFLFKILSINGALSLQAHPDKSLAAQLHKSFPQHYKDPNHKPEMVVAVQPMRVMCGFRTFSEILRLLDAYPEFAELVGVKNSRDVDALLLQSNASSSSSASATSTTSTEQKDDASSNSISHKRVLQQLFTRAMKADAKHVATLLASLEKRLRTAGYNSSSTSNSSNSSNSSSSSSSPSLDALLLELNEQYPNDVGVFGPFFLNYIALSPGQAMFLEPNVPHAYISGECVEVMACSDNVVRAGLTPKFRDVETLCTMLTYDMTPPRVTTGVQLDAATRVYAPPLQDFPEFMVTRTEIPSSSSSSSSSFSVSASNDAAASSANSSSSSTSQGRESKTATTYTLPAVQGASIALVLQGKGRIASSTAADSSSSSHIISLSFGSAVCIPANTATTISSEGDDGEPLVVYRCSTNQKIATSKM